MKTAKFLIAFLLIGFITACSSDDNSTNSEDINQEKDIRIEVKLKGKFAGNFSIYQEDDNDSSVFEYYEGVRIGASESFEIKESYVDSTFVVEENFKTRDSYFGVNFYFMSTSLPYEEYLEWESSHVMLTEERKGVRKVILDTIMTKENGLLWHNEKIYQ